MIDESIRQLNGIELVKEIIWDEWIPGKTYTKILKLRNVDRISHNCSFVMPYSGIFSSVHKNQFKIPPGTKIELPITFRPTNETEVCEEMLFNLSGIAVSLYLKAILPTFLLTIPEKIDFGCVAINTTKTRIFTLKNMTKLKTSFKLMTKFPLQILPDTGTLNPFEKKVIEISFASTTLGLNRIDVICRFGNRIPQKTRLMRVTGTVESARLRILSGDTTVHDNANAGLTVTLLFDNVSTGQSLQKYAVIENYSNVEGSIRIEPISRNTGFDKNTMFRSLSSVVTIPGQSSSKINFTYTPRMPKAYDVGYFKICSLNNYYETTIKCIGKSKDYPLIYELLTGHTQLYTDETNQQYTVISTVFPLVKGLSNGVIKANETIQLVIGFYPHRLQQSGDNHQNGYEVYAEMMRSSEILVNPPSITLNQTIWNFTSNVNLLSTALNCIKQFNKTIEQGIELNIEHLSLRNTLIVQNSTQHVMTINWSPNKQFNDKQQDKFNARLHNFTIEPLSKELPPYSSIEFTILFTPTNLCQYYHQEFEGFAMYKNQRDGSLINPENIKPPYCLLVNCYGHTFPNDKQSLTPCYVINKSLIRFDSIEYCENRFDSILLHNQSEYSLFLEHSRLLKCLNYENFNNNFFNIQLIPSICLIPPKSYKTIIFHCEINSSHSEIKKAMSFRQDEIVFKGLEIVSLNKRTEYEWKIPIEINFTTPNVTFDGNGELYFAPTQVGSYTQKEFSITNVSPYKIEFRWLIQIMEFYYRNCIYKPCLVYWRLNEFNHSTKQLVNGYHSNDIKQKHLRVITMSGSVQLSVDPKIINCQPLLVNTSIKEKINFHNLSIVSTHFETIIKPVINEENNNLKLNEFITVNSNENIISGYSTQSLTIHICPKSKGSFCFHLFYRLYTTEYDISNQKNSNEISIKSDTKRKYLTDELLAVTIFVESVYPTLRITDIHGSGSLNNISPVELWRSLDLDSLNISLEVDPTAYELQDTINSRSLYRDHPKSIDTRGPEFDLLIGTSILCNNCQMSNSKAVLCFLVENSSLIGVDFAFMFPEDLCIDLPNWAESGHYEDVELQQLNLIGITLPLNQPYLQPFTNCKYVFTPTPIGLGDYRLGYLYQMKLRNPSSRTLHFHVSPLNWLLNDHNDKELYKSVTNEKCLQYDLPILYCIHNQGLIKPNSLYALDWRFRPIEAKTYQAYCYLHIMDAEETSTANQPVYSDSILLELIAIGYNVKQMGPKEVIADPQRVRIPTAIENHIIPLDQNRSDDDDDIDENDLTLQNFPPLIRRIKMPLDSWVSLSHHLLELHRVALGTRCRRLIHMTNRFSSDFGIDRLPVNNHSVYRFRWITEFPDDMEYVNIKPKMGRIKPGQSIQVLITFIANGLPRFTEINLICELIDEHEENKYFEELKAWQSELDRLKVEFTITENNLVTEKTKQVNKKKVKPEVVSSESSEVDMDKFCQKWPKPIQSKPVNVYLTISAEIINYEAAKNYGVNYEGRTSFIDFTQFLTSNHSTVKTISNNKVQDHIMNFYRKLFTDLLTSLIADLLFNNEFVQIIQKVGIPSDSIHDASLNMNQIKNDNHDVDDDDSVPLWIQIKMDNYSKSNDLTTNYVDNIGTNYQLNDWLPEIVKERMNKQGIRGTLEETVDTECIQNPVVQSLVEDALVGMIYNILDEANEKEFEITTRPRIIALPPKKTTPQ
ncbi:Cilia- and flagella-associated protein [Schistosoma japonicum]|nr:Cilia- and flagella-associated protein [Schistosoma japonicum]